MVTESENSEKTPLAPKEAKIANVAETAKNADPVDKKEVIIKEDSLKPEDLSAFKPYTRKGVSLLRPYIVDEDLSGVSVSPQDKPSEGGMIAINPENHKDKWYVAKAYFEKHLQPSDLTVKGPDVDESTTKSFGNTDINAAKKNVSDLVVFGNGDTFKLICKASSKQEGWMKSTKAMAIHGIGCVVQVTTQQGNNVSEALVFVPGAKIHEVFSNEVGKEEVVVSRSLVV